VPENGNSLASYPTARPARRRLAEVILLDLYPSRVISAFYPIAGAIWPDTWAMRKDSGSS
jgi:hypothetical protein